MTDHAVLFVCLGNICRSPLAEGVFRHLVAERGLSDRFRIDSCGTGGWHVGEAPDRRSVQVALDHGIDIGSQRSRQLDGDDYRRFDWLVAMDESNASTMRRRAPRDATAHILLFTDLVPACRYDGVPDPYYGGERGFEDVYDLLQSGAEPLLDRILAEGSG